MTLQEFKDLENRVVYKGQNVLRIRPLNDDETLWNLGIYLRVQDSEGPSMVTVGCDNPYTLLSIEESDMDNTIAWLRDQLMLSEMHETNEHFKVDGVARFHPHKRFGHFRVVSDRDERAA
jgi:hypothetical protein